MPLRYLLAANGPEKIQPRFDTSLRMTAELLKRGILVDYLNQDSFDPRGVSTQRFLSALPVASKNRRINI